MGRSNAVVETTFEYRLSLLYCLLAKNRRIKSTTIMKQWPAAGAARGGILDRFNFTDAFTEAAASLIFTETAAAFISQTEAATAFILQKQRQPLFYRSSDSFQ